MHKKHFSIELFTHTIQEKVKFHEIDLLGICNNAIYFNYFEDARLDYAKNLVEKYNLKKYFQGTSFFIMAHNEADYYQSAFLDDELTVYTRIEFVKKSSWGHEHFVVRNSTGEVLTHGKGVLVHIDKKSKKPSALPEEVVLAIRDFDKEVKIID
jgi:acyl-CoA thioester hydrolase